MPEYGIDAIFALYESNRGEPMLYNRHNTYFNLIIDSGDEYGVAQTCADNHFCAVKVKFAFVIFRKKSLIRSDYSADERQLNLSSAGWWCRRIVKLFFAFSANSSHSVLDGTSSSGV